MREKGWVGLGKTKLGSFKEIIYFCGKQELRPQPMEKT